LFWPIPDPLLLRDFTCINNIIKTGHTKGRSLMEERVKEGEYG
jgi:hypothetical protein